jgi:head-tail adaptor
MRDVTPRKFNKLVYVESAATAQDATTKELKPANALFCRAYASIEPLTGRELLNARAVEADVTDRIQMQWSRTTAQITPRYRIRYDSPVYGSRYYNILTVKNIEERNRLLEIMAVEQTA